jgi:hypothetical protein
VNGLDPELEAHAQRTHAAILSGDLASVAETSALLAAAAGAEARAWQAAILAAAWVLDPAHFSQPAIEELDHIAGADSATFVPGALALTHLERQAVVTFDAARLDGLVNLHERMLAGRQAGPEAELWLQAARSWCALLQGDIAGLDERAQAIERHALALKIAPLVIDASVQQALSATLSGEVEKATQVARRASRMARTEALPQQEFLAHLVLARARRLSRLAHLSIRILTALEPVIASHYDGWMAWELLMAGDIEVSGAILARTEAKTRAVEASRSLLAVEQTAAAADRAGFERAESALVECTRGIAVLDREVVSLRAALDYRAALPEAPPELARWCTGKDPLPPPELHGLCMRAERRTVSGDDVAEAYVLTAPGTAPRRILGLGSNVVDLPGTVRLGLTRRHQARVEIMAAVLAAAGSEGIGYVESFEQAYELRFEPEVHRGTFEVLLHRVRTHLEQVADLERTEGVLRMIPRVPLLVPDPRCTRHVHDRLLRVLARQGRATASGAAQEVGLSLRAVQGALKALIEEGVCVSEKDGRQVVYYVEDTTFSETTARLALKSKR